MGKTYKDCFKRASERYAAAGVDTEAALERLGKIAVSMHCWQGDDVGGFESDASLDGGIAVTGSYPGRARNPKELRQDIDQALKLIPGRKRLNLHAIYAEFDGKKVDRDKLEPKHFAKWIEFAKSRGLGLDFNPTFFSHPKAADGFTLSNKSASIRKFWIDHAIACRKIGAAMGKALQNPCVTNIWIPDGYKDVPYDREAPRARLKDSLDKIFAVPVSAKWNLDAVESKLFGIGSESYVTGSHEFYMGYAVKNGKLLCLDTGHFHPTEVVSDKISSALLFCPAVLLHVSRGVRWDSDHVVTFSDELQEIAREIIRHKYDSRVHIGLDYFDGSINRIASWVLGMRNTYKALLAALLEPEAKLKKAEDSGDYTSRLVLMEESRCMPFIGVWEEFCRRWNVPAGPEWLDEVKAYEKKVLSRRG